MPPAQDRAIEERVACSFDAEAVFDAGDLQEFARYMLANKGALENLLDHEVRTDVMKKPTQQLGLVLKMMGLRLSKPRTVGVSGKKVYRYRLDPTALREMQELAATREQKRGWAFLSDLYGSHMDPSEHEEWGITDDEEWAALDDHAWVGLDDEEWAEVEESIRKAEEFLRRTTRRFL